MLFLLISLACVGNSATYSNSNGPGVEQGEIAQEKDLSLRRSDAKVVHFRPPGIEAAFVPLIQDLRYFPTAPPKDESDGPLIGPVAAVTFDLDLFVMHVHAKCGEIIPAPP